MPTISLCMITKNEEAYLEQCLSSAKDIVDEIIIVDTGSTDSTKKIAAKFNAKIYDFRWNDDFSAARNESLKHATKDWILVLDADEVIENSDLGKIKDLIENPDDACGFALEQRSYIKNHFEGAIKNNSDFEAAKDYPFYVRNNLVRLFKNKLGIRFSHRVHELAEDSMNEKSLKYEKTGIVIHHFGSVKGSASMNSKSEKYAGIILKQLGDNPESPRYNYQAARMYLGRKDFTNALEYFEKTAKLNPDYKLVFSEIAKIYLSMDDKNHAIEYFRKSMEQHPENPSPANNLAVIYMSIGKFGEAKKILEEQLKKHPENKALKYNYQQALRDLSG